MIHKYIEKIVENNRQEDMQELSETPPNTKDTIQKS